MLARVSIFGRYAISSGMALGITFGLFFLMQALVAMGNASVDEKKETRVMDFVRVKRTQAVPQKERQLPSRPKAKQAPPSPNMKMDSPSVGKVAAGPMAIKAPEATAAKLRDAPKLGGAPVSDRGEVPLARFQPPYPIRAAQDGIEGFVRVRFDVDPDGHVQNVTVIQAQPRGVFETTTERTMKKWRYRPKVVDGKPTWRRGLAVRIPFKLND